MISNFSKQSKKDDIKLLMWIIISFLFIAWFCTPPGNKFLQVCFWGNSTKFMIAKLKGNVDSTEYLFHRNNAVYLAKMYPKKDKALKEIDKAIKTLPSFASEKELQSLYYDRANIKLFANDYKGALNDFLNSGEISFNDNLKVALLFKEAGNYRKASEYCNRILNTDSTAYSGYACLADLYSSLGRYDVALNIWDLAIDRKKNNPRVYADRALTKKKMGDLAGYEEDVKKAKEYMPTINIEESIIHDTLHPKILALSIKKS